MNLQDQNVMKNTTTATVMAAAPRTGKQVFFLPHFELQEGTIPLTPQSPF
jgi:hypothetical protein